MTAQEKWIPLGKIYQEWGLRGQVRLAPFNPDSEIYPKLKEIYLERPGASWQSISLAEVKPHGRYWLIKLAGYDSPEASRELRGLKVAIPREKLPVLKKGEVYLADLEGFSVKTHLGEVLGRLKNFVRVAGTEIMNIEKLGGGEVMVPYQSDFATTLWEERVILLKENAEDLLS